MDLLRTYDVSHSFEYELFKNINISLRGGESLAITGVSGSGKSTLLHNLATFLKPCSGKVELLGEDIYNLSSKKLLNIRRNKLGIIFQSHYLFNGLSAEENLKISSILCDKDIPQDLLKALKIDNLLDKNITDLSGGQQQRFSIARVLIKKPSIIFADEPTGNLDQHTADLVMEYIFDYIKSNDAALFLVTHDEKLASRCDMNHII